MGSYLSSLKINSKIIKYLTLVTPSDDQRFKLSIFSLFQPWDGAGGQAAPLPALPRPALLPVGHLRQDGRLEVTREENDSYSITRRVG